MWLKGLLIFGLGMATGIVSTKIQGEWFFVPLIAGVFVCMWMDQRYDVTLKRRKNE